MWLPILFAPSVTSQAAGRAFLARIMAREDRDEGVSMETVKAQAAALAAYGAEKDETYAHLKDLRQPTLVVNGNNDIISIYLQLAQADPRRLPARCRRRSVDTGPRPDEVPRHNRGNRLNGRVRRRLYHPCRL
jgi:hypothetical protein